MDMLLKSLFTYSNYITLIIIWISFVILGFSTTNGQISIVGKWKEVSTKQFFTTEGTKQTGKSFIEKIISSTDKVEIEFKSDKSYTEIVGHVKYHILTGTWSVLGNQLTMIGTAEAKAGMEGRTYTFLIVGNTLTKTILIKPPNNTIVFKQEDTNVKME